MPGVRRPLRRYRPYIGAPPVPAALLPGGRPRSAQIVRSGTHRPGPALSGPVLRPMIGRVPPVTPVISPATAPRGLFVRGGVKGLTRRYSGRVLLTRPLYPTAVPGHPPRQPIIRIDRHGYGGQVTQGFPHRVPPVNVPGRLPGFVWVRQNARLRLPLLGGRIVAGLAHAPPVMWRSLSPRPRTTVSARPRTPFSTTPRARFRTLPRGS